jgi:hypothetical protein
MTVPWGSESVSFVMCVCAGHWLPMGATAIGTGSPALNPAMDVFCYKQYFNYFL